MGFGDQEIVALSGAHAVGECHINYSGYAGPWTTTPNIFNNMYFVFLSKREHIHATSLRPTSSFRQDALSLRSVVSESTHYLVPVLV